MVSEADEAEDQNPVKDQSSAYVEEMHWESRTDKLKSKLRKAGAILKQEEYRGVWDGERFLGRAARVEKGVVYFEQLRAEPDKPQPSLRVKIIRAVKEEELGGPAGEPNNQINVGTKYWV